MIIMRAPRKYNFRGALVFGYKNIEVIKLGFIRIGKTIFRARIIFVFIGEV